MSGISRAPDREIRRVAIKIVLWPTVVTVERCESFVHLKCTSFSPGIDVSWRVALQTAALRVVVHERCDRPVLPSHIQFDLALANDFLCNSWFVAPTNNSH